MSEIKDTIRVRFVGFWDGFDYHNHSVYKVLSERYIIDTDSKPDFVICACFGKPYEYMAYDCVRIMLNGEFIQPNFQHFDYVLSYDYIDFGDRYFRYPLYFDHLEYPHLDRLRETITEEDARNLLKNKEYFCNFIFAHQTQNNIRESIFTELNKYKRVESFGTFMNNQPDGKTVRARKGGKPQILKKSKFTIACESLAYPGFTTEKIGNAIANYSIPIYFGDPLLERVFNPDAVINYDDYGSVEAVVSRVIELDKDDDLYVETLLKSPTIDPGYAEKEFEKLKSFLFNIFDQDPKCAFRRMIGYRSAVYDSYAKDYLKICEQRDRQKNTFLGKHGITILKG